MQAAELVGTEQAERRVLLLANPGLPFPAATTTLSANIQVVRPGEIARAHRHTAAALRLIIESQGGTVVNGHRIPMLPGDLVLTPNWTWHDHANDSDAPMIWLDGLDSPLIRLLECGFREEYEAESQPVDTGVDPSFAKYGAGGLQQGWEPAPTAKYSPLWHYPYTQAREALKRLAAEGAASPFDGVIMGILTP
jgi:gentisate 1,2-dioxygenase